MILRKITKWINNWYWILGIGILLMLTSILIFTSPAISLSILMHILSLGLFAYGTTSLILKWRNRKALTNWKWSAVSSAIMAILGVYLFSRPDTSLLYINTVFALMLISKAIQPLGIARNSSSSMNGISGISWIGSILLIIAGIFVWSRPAILGMLLISFSGLPFLIMGIVAVGLALLLKNANVKIQTAKSALKEDIQDAEYEIID